jgi:hypothetical protein
MAKKRTLQEDMIYVYATIEDEGFDYCFNGYSDFKDIEDPEFHRLRLEYLEAAKRLQKYVSENAYPENEDLQS